MFAKSNMSSSLFEFFHIVHRLSFSTLTNFIIVTSSLASKFKAFNFIFFSCSFWVKLLGSDLLLSRFDLCLLGETR